MKKKWLIHLRKWWGTYKEYLKKAYLVIRNESLQNLRAKTSFEKIPKYLSLMKNLSEFFLREAWNKVCQLRSVSLRAIFANLPIPTKVLLLLIYILCLITAIIATAIGWILLGIVAGMGVIFGLDSLLILLQQDISEGNVETFSLLCIILSSLCFSIAVLFRKEKLRETALKYSDRHRKIVTETGRFILARSYSVLGKEIDFLRRIPISMPIGIILTSMLAILLARYFFRISFF